MSMVVNASALRCPCLNLAIAPVHYRRKLCRLGAQSPHPGGYVFHDCPWPQTLIHSAWQEMFVYKPLQYSLERRKSTLTPPDLVSSPFSPATSYVKSPNATFGDWSWHRLFELTVLRHGTLNGNRIGTNIEPFPCDAMW